jgi:hypothetical protein
MLCQTTDLTASSLGIYWHSMRAVSATHSIAAAQQCTVNDAPHNVLTATNIAASKYLLLLELRCSHGKRHSDEDKSAPCRQLCSGWASFYGIRWSQL